MHAQVWETLLWTSWNIAPRLGSSHAHLSSPAAQSNSDYKKKKKKPPLPNLANGHFERAASQVPFSKPERPHFGGGDAKGEVWHVCHCLSLQSPRGGWTRCYAFRGCLINMGWLADQPRMWEQSVPLSELGEMDRPNHFLRFRVSSSKSAWLQALGSSRATGTEREGGGDWNSKRPSERLWGAQNVFTVLRAWNKQRRSMPITA